ncbi:hypothetical protein DY000_02021522 [Brassica cretica]|uniref:Uncharacterized protein n=1 Tax=Brassica cretica TaxID=69181 RepID=A0ABQ7E7N8_BRACR|nr:hypothetical protein DY000_02021522 [Brassica cretica]
MAIKSTESDVEWKVDVITPLLKPVLHGVYSCSTESDVEWKVDVITPLLKPVLHGVYSCVKL